MSPGLESFLETLGENPFPWIWVLAEFSSLQLQHEGLCFLSGCELGDTVSSPRPLSGPVNSPSLSGAVKGVTPFSHRRVSDPHSASSCTFKYTCA